MGKILSNGEHYVSIGKAALLLGVSVDTLRRWTNAGKLTSYRLNGKDRLFLAEELKTFQQCQSLSIGQVAILLQLSEGTLRRMDAKGVLIANRDSNGERVYSKAAVERFLAMKRGKKTIPFVKRGTSVFKTKNSQFHKPYSPIHMSILRSLSCFIAIFFVYGLVIRMYSG